MKNHNQTDKVLSCLQKELTCYDSLLIKMEKQKEAIGKGDESLFLTILQENDELIESIRKLDQEIEQALNGITKAEKENLIQQVAPFKNRIQGSLNKVIDLENECRDIIENQKAGITDQMKALKERKHMMGKYQSTITKGTSFSNDV